MRHLENRDGRASVRNVCSDGVINPFKDWIPGSQIETGMGGGEAGGEQEQAETTGLHSLFWDTAYYLRLRRVKSLFLSLITTVFVAVAGNRVSRIRRIQPVVVEIGR